MHSSSSIAEQLDGWILQHIIVRNSTYCLLHCRHQILYYFFFVLCEASHHVSVTFWLVLLTHSCCQLWIVSFRTGNAFIISFTFSFNSDLCREQKFFNFVKGFYYMMENLIQSQMKDTFNQDIFKTIDKIRNKHKYKANVETIFGQIFKATGNENM